MGLREMAMGIILKHKLLSNQVPEDHKAPLEGWISVKAKAYSIFFTFAFIRNSEKALFHEEDVIGALALLDNRLFFLNGYKLCYIEEHIYSFVRYGVCAS
jgi:hypothetical protein